MGIDVYQDHVNEIETKRDLSVPEGHMLMTKCNMLS